MPIDELDLFERKTESKAIAPETISKPGDELDLFEPKASDDYPTFRAAPKGSYDKIGPLPIPEYTGNKAEEYITQFMGSVAEGMSMGFVDAPPRQGLPGESTVRVAGKVAGTSPSLLAGAGVINWGLKGIISKLPKAAKSIITLSRAFFTEEAVRGAITNSADFYNALKAGDTDAMEDAAAGALIDTAFAALMAKGWVEDAQKLKALKAEMMNERFRRAKNITPEEPPPPKTLAEVQSQAETPPAPKPTEMIEPSPELVTKVDSQENIAKASNKVKDIKSKSRKKPDTEIVRKKRTVSQIRAETEAELKKTEKQKVDVKVSSITKPTTKVEQVSDLERMKELSPETVKVVQERVTKKLQPREDIIVESTGGGTQDSWLMRTRSGARMEVTFGDESVYIDQVSVPKAMQKKGVASQLYERLGDMMRQRGIPGTAIEGNVQGPPEAIAKLRAKAAAIAGEGKPGEGRYEIDLEEEVPLKINGTEGEGPKLTGAQYEEMEKIYGKDLTELTDKDVADYLEGKAKPPGEVKLAKAVKELSDEDIEKFYGKPVGEISDEEIDRFFDITPEYEEVEAVDLQAEAPEPPELVSEDSSVFRQDPETTRASMDNYKRSQSVAISVKDLMVKDPTKPFKDVGPTTWSLITKVNDWLNGGESNIEETRNFLSELASRADEFRWQFNQFGMSSVESQEAFNDWKELVSDAAVWARRVDRGKLMMMRSGGPSTEEIAKVLRGWYSALKNYAQEKLGNRATGKQIKATLRKGATQDEWSNVGLDALLKDDVVYDKMEVLKKIEEGTVEFKDVVFDDTKDPRVSERYKYLEDRERFGRITPSEQIELDNARWEFKGTKFSTYVEPGGTNYKELFVTASTPEYKEAIRYMEESVGTSEMKDAVKEVGEFLWRDGHPDYADIENPIVRLRFDDRVDSEGKKVLFIEELQGPTKENQDLMPSYLRKRIREIGVKRAIQYAIDGGYDRVAWTTGEMQAKRYNLGDLVDEISYGKNDDGTYYVAAKKIGDYWEGGEHIVKESIAEDQLESFVGKDIARKIIEDKGVTKNIEGYDERIIELSKGEYVGNFGLTKLYNQDIPNIAKRLGGRVEEVRIEFSQRGLEFQPTENTKSVQSVAVAPLASKKPLHYMYSGGPSSEELINAAIKAAKAFKDSMTSDRESKKMRGKEIHRKTREELVRALIERSGNIAKILTSPESYTKYGDFGYRIVRNMYLSKGATPRATNTYRQFAKEVYGGLSRKEGEIVDNLAMAVRMVDIGKYKSSKQFKFPEGKDPNSSSLYLATFGQIEGLTPERAFELYHVNKDGTIGGRVGAGFETIRRTIKDMRDEAGGLIGAKEHDDLIAHKYRRLGTIENPATLAEILDKKYEQSIGDISRNVYDSGIEKLAKGRETDIFESSWKLMTFETLVRAYGRIANNEAGHTLLELAKVFPDNPFVWTRIRPTQELSTQPFKRNKLNESIQIKRLEQGISDYELKELVKQVAGKNISYKRASIDELKAVDKALGPISKGYAEKAEAPPKGWIPTYVYDKGHRTTVRMEPSFAKEWIVNSRDISPRAARIVRWATMAPITRTFATGIDPGFMLANVPRDMLHLWFAAREYVGGQWKPVYSSNAPVFAEQIREDLVAVAGDALLRKGWWNDYIKYGGGMDFLVLQSRPFQKGLRIDNTLDEIFNYLGYMNESSEIVTRLAIMVRALKNSAARNGMTLEEARNNPEMMRDAVFAARDYMDFSQGGWLVKLIDQGVPYLNASVVGMRTFARSFKTGKNASQKSWYKLGQFALIVAGLYIASKKWAPETMKELKGDVRSQNNIILPLGDIFGFEDETGQKRYPFLKIPLDPSVRSLKKFFELSTDTFMGEEGDVSGTLASLKQVSPVDISTLPPLEAAIYEYCSNYDLYKMKTIRREEEMFSWPKSRAEFGAETPQALVDIGKVTGASPERIKVAMGEMISSSSVWAQVLGEAYNKLFGQMPEDLREQHLAESLSKFPVIRRFIGLTNPYTRFSESIEKANEDATFDRFIQRRNLDILINGHLYKKSVSRDEIELYMRSFNDKQIYDRLNDRLKFAERTVDMPHRSLWMKMEAQSNEARARTYMEEVFNDPRLLEEFNSVNNRMRNTSRGGLSTEGFRREVIRLQTKAGESEEIRSPLQ